jgi:uncharacterized membrane protein YphA (DoxX/SURF4 family)
MSIAGAPSLEPTPLAELAPEPRPWSPLRRVLFRFGFIYWTLFCLPLAIGLPVIDTLFGDAVNLRRWKVSAAFAKHVLKVRSDVAVEHNGSGDRVVNWVYLLLITVAALVGTVLWSLVTRRREHERLREALRVLMRYVLGFVMLGYGIIKLFGGQFPPPSTSRLLQPFGDASPMGLMWTFMGASKPYVVFSGAGETVGALLVLFRRTTTLGALILAGVLTNIVMLNFCYDVPVKIGSSHYLAMCILLMQPDLRRLADVLVFHRPAAVRTWCRTFRSRRARIAHHVAKSLLVVSVVGAMVYAKGKAARQQLKVHRSWIDGSWRVKRFVRNGQELPALMDDHTRWSRLKFETWPNAQYIRWHFSDRTFSPLFTFKIDEREQQLTLTTAEKPEEKLDYPLAFTRVDADHFRLSGRVRQDDLVIEAERIKAGDMLLVRRGFHFVNEFPFNR